MNSELDALNELLLLDRLDELDQSFFTENESHLETTKNSSATLNPEKHKKSNKNHQDCPKNDIILPSSKSSENEFPLKYGFSKESVHEIYRMIEYGFKKESRRGNPKSPMYSLLLTLQFLTTGSMDYHTDAESASQSTVSRILKKVTGLLAELKPRFIKIPEINKYKQNAHKFEQIAGFPNVFACIGSSHIAIKTPIKSVADDYLNEDGFYSFRLFACTGPNLEFFEIITRWPGASHENKIFNLSEMFQRFEFSGKMDGVLLANERYSCTNYVMTPVEAPKNLNENRYNAAHKKTYNFLDAIRLLKSRFKCLQNVLAFQDGKTDIVLVALVEIPFIAWT